MLIDDYINYHNKYSKKYGSKTVVLMQVGSFFECYAIENDNPLEKFNSENYKTISHVQFTKKDVERHPVVADVLSIYDEAS